MSKIRIKNRQPKYPAKMSNTIRLFLYLISLLAVKASSEDLLIVGGNFAPKDFFPYIVSLMSDGSHTCGGAIIGRKWVLTAAHCVTEPADYEIEYGANRHGRGHKAQVNQIIMHPNFVKGKTVENDIALVKVTKEFKFSDRVKIIELNGNKVRRGMNGMIAGWGDSTGNDDYPDRLKMTNVTTVECPRIYRHWEHIICVQNRHAAVCFGDSGGPLEIDGVLVGATSFRAVLKENDVTCKPNDISAYTHIRKYQKWIMHYIRS